MRKHLNKIVVLTKLVSGAVKGVPLQRDIWIHGKCRCEMPKKKLVKHSCDKLIFVGATKLSHAAFIEQYPEVARDCVLVGTVKETVDRLRAEGKECLKNSSQLNDEKI